MAGDRLPPTAAVRRHDTHRLIPSRHLDGGRSVLAELADTDADLQALFDLDAATNDRLLAHDQRFPGIGIEELVFGIPHGDVINAAFCHPHPLGARFNGPERGAWYAAFELPTAQTEVAFHKSVQLAEIDRFDDSVTCDDYLADISATLHDLRGVRAFRSCLDARSYVRSQELAERLLHEGSLGVVYPSVRHDGGTCVACFRPAIVGNVRRGKTYRFTWDGAPHPRVTIERRAEETA